MVRLNSDECEPHLSEIHQGKGFCGWSRNCEDRLGLEQKLNTDTHTHCYMGNNLNTQQGALVDSSPSIQCNTRRHLKYYILEGHLRA